MLVGIAAYLSGVGDIGRLFTFTTEEAVALAMIASASVAFYALIGFEHSVNVTEEARDPSRVHPRALLGGLAVAGVIYILVSFVGTLVVVTGTLAGSTGPLLEVVKLGPLSFLAPPQLFSLKALIAITNTALINMIMASRVAYGMARQGMVPSVLGRVHKSRRTPWVAIVFVTLIALILVSTGNLSALSQTTVALLLIVFTLVNIAVLVPPRDPVGHHHFRTLPCSPSWGL